MPPDLAYMYQPGLKDNEQQPRANCKVVSPENKWAAFFWMKGAVVVDLVSEQGRGMKGKTNLDSHA